MANNGKKLYNNNQFQNSKPPLNNQNKNVDDDDDDFLDISDNELIRASQVVESQLKFTNNVHHTTKDALNIFSQFNNDVQQSQFQPMSQMCAPNMTIMGHPTKAPIYGSQMTPLEALSQLDDAKYELKSVKDQKMMKDGEVKILREKLKKQDQDLQRIRTEKLDLMKKLQLQQVEAKKNLDKQLEFKELENQFKSQELADISIKFKQLEAKLKKTERNHLNSSSITFTGIKQETNHQYSHNMSSQNIFDEEFSRKKQQPPLNPNPAINLKNHGTKRLAQSPTDSIFLSDGENENPISTVHENKRPSLQTLEKDSSKANNQTGNQQTRSHLSSINTNFNYSTPNLQTESKKEQQRVQAVNQCNQINTSLPSNGNQLLQPSPFQTVQPTSTISTPKIPPNKSQKEPAIVYKRTARLNLKLFHKVKLSGDQFMTASLDNTFSSDPIKIKSYANEKIYKLIDLFSESANSLNKFNSTTINEEAHEGTESFVMNTNATSLNIQNLSKQLNDLLEFISYKSSTSPITNDLFSSFITASLTESSISASSSSNNSLLIIDRVEFVSKNLNTELVNMIQYCLNASLTQNGEVSLNSNSQNTENSRSLSSFNSGNSGRIKKIDEFQSISKIEKIFPASANSLTDLVCCSFEVCVSLFLFRASLLIINYSQNEQNKKTYKLIKSKLLNSNQQLAIHRKLMKLKKDFFRLVKLLLNSINFSSVSMNFASAVFDQDEYNTLGSLSTSSSPYSALKILSSVLDCLNHFVYLPIMYQRDEPNSIIAWFYYSLSDHMHHIYKQKMNLSEFYQDTNKKSEPEGDEKMDQDNDIIPIDLEEIVDVQGEEATDAEFDSDYNNEEEPCLFQLFYQKLIKYFGDIVYALESCEARLQYSIEENAALISSITAASSSSSSYSKPQTDNTDVNSIITTIADESNKRELNFSLENKPQTTSLPYSKSQNDLQLELLQTQSSTEDIKKQKNETSSAQSNSNNTESNNLERCRKYLKNRTNSDCIQLLQTRLMSSFIYFLHNFQLVSTMGSKIFRRIEPDQEANSKKCFCYKDMINSLIILIDYQFNEKFFYGADLSFNQCFLSKLTANCLFFPNQIKNDRYNCINNENEEIKADDVKIDKKILQSNKFNKNFSNALCNLNEKSNQFQFLMIVRCSFALNTILKNQFLPFDPQMEDTRMKFFESVREDYRLKNFYCLYMLVDLIYEEFIKESMSLAQVEDSSNYVISKKSSANHLLSTVNHIKNVFKVDEYFDLE